MAASKTPVMQQHAEAKLAHPDAIVFFRLGDFYEMFGDDAGTCSRVLDLTLTSRNKGKPDEVPMAGVPHHAAHGYIGRLLALGYKVAICEQMADPKLTKGIVPRAVVRVITPGTVTHDDHLETRENNWLAALELGPSEVGVSLFDLSTGELSLGRVSDAAAALGELSRARAREILIGGEGGDEAMAAVISAVQKAVPRALVKLDDALGADQLEEWLPPDALSSSENLVARLAAARNLRFARACNPGSQLPALRVTRLEPQDGLLIDPVAQAHLELVKSASGDARLTLLGAIDLTLSAGGSRLLRRRLLSPLCDVAQIRRRLDMVEAFVVHSGLRDAARRELGQVSDIERLSVRASFGEASPKDLGRLRDGLLAADATAQLLSSVEDAALRERFDAIGPLDTAPELRSELVRALVDGPPAVAKEDAIFRAGYDGELDELRSLCQSGAEHMVELEQRLRTTSDIATLKVRFTRVFGWYVEVGRSHLRRVPEGWRRKQTVASGERYTLPELDELAERIERAEEDHRVRERSLFEALMNRVKSTSQRLVTLAARIAAWDVASALAEVAHRHDYVRPEVDDGDRLEVEAGRHPVVERWAAAGRFVPNDVELEGRGKRLWMVTGPNMAGKSTLLRQTALIVILAQMGSYVPAKRARVGLVDRVLSRVGASDDLARGESTFMVEMRETAQILSSATPRSLVILDEIGRGTSTFDGLSIAWAVAEYLAKVVRCRALFATHYHELTALDESPHVENHSVSARELDGDIVFLHRLVRGPASQSYGIAVAKLAGLPAPVLARATELLASFESTPSRGPKGRVREPSTGQLSLFVAAMSNPAERQILEALARVDLDTITAEQALVLLGDLKYRLPA